MALCVEGPTRRLREAGDTVPAVWEYRSGDDLYADAAEFVVRLLSVFPEASIGVATGDTQIRLYDRLAAACEEGRVSFRRAAFYNLDEYIGLDKGDPNSYDSYMRRHFFDRVDANRERCFIPDGSGPDPESAARQYAKVLSAPRDIQFLGIGENGHIGFNEPADSLTLGVHVTALSERTRLAAGRHFGDPDRVPRSAITMGVGDILSSRSVVLLATGERKAEAVARSVSGSVTTRCPASLLQFHANAVILVDGHSGRLVPEPLKRRVSGRVLDNPG